MRRARRSALWFLPVGPREVRRAYPAPPRHRIRRPPRHARRARPHHDPCQPPAAIPLIRQCCQRRHTTQRGRHRRLRRGQHLGPGRRCARHRVLSAISRHVDCQIKAFIVDFDVTAGTPTNRQVVHALERTARCLARNLELGEGVPFSQPVATVIADSPALACQIRTALCHRGGKPCTSATVLGLDTVAGRSRCAARRSTRAARVAAVRTGRAVKSFVAGIRPAATYGADVTSGRPMERSAISGSSPRTLSAPMPRPARSRLSASYTATPKVVPALLPPSGGSPKPSNSQPSVPHQRLLQHSLRRSLTLVAHRQRPHRRRVSSSVSAGPGPPPSSSSTPRAARTTLSRSLPARCATSFIAARSTALRGSSLGPRTSAASSLNPSSACYSPVRSACTNKASYPPSSHAASGRATACAARATTPRPSANSAAPHTASRTPSISVSGFALTPTPSPPASAHDVLLRFFEPRAPPTP